MAQTIKLRRSATAGATPTTSQLELGEVAINTYDGKMYIKKSVGGTESIVELGSGLTPADAILEEYLYTATASQTAFSGNDDNSDFLSYTAGALQVFLNGILLDPETDYTATNGALITLTAAAAVNDYLQIFAFKKKIGDSSITINTFSGNNSTTAFTLTLDPGDENNTRVFIDGVYQSKSNYTVSGTTLTFSSAPPSGTGIEVEIGNRAVSLDTASNLDLPDNVKLRLGTSQDLEIYHDASDSLINDNGTGSLKLQTGGSTKLEVTSTGVDVTGNVAVSGTVDGVDIAARDAVLTSTTTTAGAALPKAGGAMTGAITTNSTFDGRDVATDGTKLDGIETAATADQTQSEINALGITATGLSGTPAISVANITTTGELRGPASLVIDPAGIGDNTGTVVIKGNLQVDGATTTINSTTLTVDDLNLTLASGAANGTAANGAGITIDGASATLTYNSTGDNWAFNKNVDVTGSVTADGLVVDTGANSFNALQIKASSATAGTYGLGIGSSSDFTIYANGTSKNLIRATAFGDISFYDGSGNQGLFWDSSESSLGIGTTAVSSFAINDLVVGSGSSVHGMTIYTGTSHEGIIRFADGTSGAQQYAGQVKYNHSNNSLNFYTNGSGTIRLALDSSGNATFSGSVTATNTILNTGSTTVSAILRGGDGNSKNLVFQKTTGSAQQAKISAVGDDLRFTTGTTHERMRITSTGSVGIGTVNPGRKLTVQGATDDNLPARFIGGANTTHGSIEFQDPSTTADYRVQIGSKGDDLYLQAGGGEKVRIKDTGNVGIGTTTPDYKLDVEGSGNGLIVSRVRNTTAGTTARADMLVESDASDIRMIATSSLYTGVAGWADTGIINTSSGTSGGMLFNVQGNYPYRFMQNATTERMRIHTNGNVGIGTTAPSEKLVVNVNSTGIKAGLILNNQHGYGSGVGVAATALQFARDNTPSNGQAIISGQIYSGNENETTSNPCMMAFSTKSGTAPYTLTERMRISSTGNVGIGTTTPDQKLSIKGRVSSDLADSYYGAWFEGNSATNGYSFFSVGPWYNGAGYFQRKQGTAYSHIYEYAANHHIVLQAGYGANGETAGGGNVGIGTTTPHNKLHVNGTGRINSLIVGDASASNTPAVALHIKSSATNARLRIEDSDSSNDYWDFYVNQGDGLHFQEDGTNRVTFKTGGNVGIGTTDPKRPLQIGATGSFPISFNGNYPDIHFNTYYESGWRIHTAGFGAKTTFNGATGAFGFSNVASTQNAAATFTPIERLTILANGNVGIGTDNPTDQLHVRTTDTTGDIRIGGGNGANNHRVYIHAHPTGAYIDSYGGGAHNSLGIQASVLHLNSASGGNVLVGQSTAGTNGKLQVNGGIGLTGTAVIRLQSNGDDSNSLKFFGNQFVAGQNNSHSYSYSGGGLIASVSPSAGAILMDVGANSTSGHRLKVINGSNGVNGSLQYLSGTTSRFHVDSSSGKVGIGTASPGTKFHVSAGSTNANIIARLEQGTTAGNYSAVEVGRTDGGGNVQITPAVTGGVPISGIPGILLGSTNGALPAVAIQTPNSSSGHIVFNPKGTERVRISADGNLVVGGGSVPGSNIVYIDAGRIMLDKTSDWNIESGGSSNGSHIRFRQSSADVGSITSTSSGVSYLTTSDRRLKDNIETITDGTDKLMAMNPVTHGWKADPEADPVHGFIAQEMMEIIPEAVSGDPEGEEMMSMDYGRITPVIVAALQDALKEIKELKTRINELENK